MISRVSSVQVGEEPGGVLGVDLVVGGGEPGSAGNDLAIGGPLFASPTSTGLPPRGDRAVAHHAVQPGDGPVGLRVLPRQRDERVLDDVLRRVAPLAGVERQHRGVLVEQATEDLRPDPCHP